MSESFLVNLDKDEFINWLSSKNPDEVVGYRVVSYYYGRLCPLARFLQEKTGGMVYVSATAISYGNRMVYTPYWAREFIRRVSRLCDRETITAGTALEIMRECGQ